MSDKRIIERLRQQAELSAAIDGQDKTRYIGWIAADRIAELERNCETYRRDNEDLARRIMGTDKAQQLPVGDSDTIQHWKEFHREIASILGCKVFEVNVTLQAARDLVAAQQPSVGDEQIFLEDCLSLLRKSRWNELAEDLQKRIAVLKEGEG